MNALHALLVFVLLNASLTIADLSTPELEKKDDCTYCIREENKDEMIKLMAEMDKVCDCFNGNKTEACTPFDKVQNSTEAYNLLDNYCKKAVNPFHKILKSSIDLCKKGNDSLGSHSADAHASGPDSIKLPDVGSDPASLKENKTNKGVPPKVNESNSDEPPKVNETNKGVSAKVNESNSDVPPKVNETNKGVPVKLNESNSDEPPKVHETNKGVPAKVNESNSDVPPKVNETNKGVPAKLNESNSDVPPKVNETNKGVPAKVNESKSDVPPKVNETNKEVPAKLNESNSDAPPKVNETNKGVPAKVNESKSDVPPKVNETNNGVPAKLNESNSDAPPKVNETNKVVPAKVNESKSDVPPKVNGTNKGVPAKVNESNSDAGGKVNKTNSGKAPTKDKATNGTSESNPDTATADHLNRDGEASESKKYSLGAILTSIFLSFGAGILIAVLAKMFYNRYRKASYALPPDQGMQDMS